MTTSGPDTNTSVSEPELAIADEATTAVVRGVVPVAELPAFFDNSFRALAATISTQKIVLAGAAFGLYHGPPTETADLEVGFATDGVIRPDGDVVSSSLPGGRVARMVHFGAFDGLGASWERLQSWIDEQGLTPGQVMWEIYVTEPSSDMDPRELRTELNWPVMD